ncbi:hypothetical protein OPV22_010393 [Ensete ventricosum]|uniref:CRIB domain-containing protein n=1 Tax=Ensete ventricosum TaxID=4639 RepID=A0AAV8RKR6_ENSVE|nr:hypothetical protein OPV22_010393 [Ensete ventricosum]
MPSSELPPARSASVAASLHRREFLIISPLLSPSITALTQRSISALATMPVSAPLARTPTPHTSSTYLAFVGWSVHNGKATMGTPSDIASSVEFHPQCVTKQPNAGWARTASCGLHCTTRPRSTGAFRNARGSVFSNAAPTTHKKCFADASRPHTSSSICSALTDAMLPKETYTTERGGFEFSHLMHVSSSSALRRLRP